MSEKVLLNSGYKEFEVPVISFCDKFYQKKINDKNILVYIIMINLKTTEH